MMKANKANKTYVRSFLIGATIITVLILHFAVSQVFFVEESAQDFSVNELTIEQPAIIKPENETEKVKTINITDAVSPSVQPETKVEVRQSIEKETETVNRKKPPRESRAQRLRRARAAARGARPPSGHSSAASPSPGAAVAARRPSGGPRPSVRRGRSSGGSARATAPPLLPCGTAWPRSRRRRRRCPTPSRASCRARSTPAPAAGTRRCWASTAAPTTTWPSRSAWKKWWRGCAR